MTAAAFVWARRQASPARRPTREKILRPITPLPAETVAYARAIKALLSEVREATEASIVPYIARSEARFTDSAIVSDDFAEELRAVLGILRVSWFRLATDRARSIARTVFGRVNTRHRDRFYAQAREAMGVDLSEIVSEEKLNRVLRLKTEENVALIKSIPEEYLARVERAVYQHVIQGQPGQKTLARKIHEIGEVSERRAKFIARDQTAKLVSALNRERNIAIGIEQYVWRTSKDERVRPSHRRKEGKTFRWDDPPEDTGHPGQDFNCLPGSAVIDFADGSHKLWRRFYSGPLVTVVASDGRRLEATPNHPVLTTRGWLAIDQLKEGDDLVHCSVDRHAVANMDEGGLETRFENLFEAAANSELPHSRPGSKLDFHGDGSEDDVDVVCLDRHLALNVMAAPRESGSQLDLSRTDLAGAAAGGDRCGPAEQAARGVLGADLAYGFVRGGREIGPLGGGHSAHPNEVGRAAISSTHEILGQDSIDGVSRDSESPRDRKFTFTGLITSDDLRLGKVVPTVEGNAPAWNVDLEKWIPGADSLAECVRAASEESGGFLQIGPIRYQLLRVVEKSVREFSDHVYNLSNDREWYTANGLIVHNCRCTASPVMKF